MYLRVLFTLICKNETGNKSILQLFYTEGHLHSCTMCQLFLTVMLKHLFYSFRALCVILTWHFIYGRCVIGYVVKLLCVIESGISRLGSV